MSLNDEFTKHLEELEQEGQLHEESAQNFHPPGKDKWPKIAVMFLIGLLCIVLLIFVIKSIAAIIVGIVSLGVLLGLFGGALELR